MFDGSREGSAGFGREVFGLFLLFWTLLILLSLFTYDPADPSLNHAVSGDPSIVNKAGLFGAYTAGLLNDIFGSASFFLPLALAFPSSPGDFTSRGSAGSGSRCCPSVCSPSALPGTSPLGISGEAAWQGGA